MKAYEKKLALEKQINWARYQLDVKESQVGVLKGQIVIIVERNKRMEAALKQELLSLEDDYAGLFDVHKGYLEEIKKFSKIKPTTDVTPVVNGKKTCDMCGLEFSSQGFPAHRKKCERIYELEKELSDLEEE